VFDAPPTRLASIVHPVLDPVDRWDGAGIELDLRDDVLVGQIQHISGVPCNFEVIHIPARDEFSIQFHGGSAPDRDGIKFQDPECILVCEIDYPA
jgi:hypothetical protein